jgi:hypothetical protein
MSARIHTYTIDSKSLPNCEDEVIRVLKYKSAVANTDIYHMINALRDASHQYMGILGGYRIFDESDIKIGVDNLRCHGILYECDTTIAQQLQGSWGLAFFAVTLGKTFDTWSRSFFEQGDPFSGYIADIIGSIQTERAADWLESEISDKMKGRGFKCTNRFSPGYCGWDVYEQHKLFDLFPEHFIGIDLNPSALMTPIKSVSGVIGIGKQVKKMNNTCKYCDQPDCFMRRRKINEHL